MSCHQCMTHLVAISSGTVKLLCVSPCINRTIQVAKVCVFANVDIIAQWILYFPPQLMTGEAVYHKKEVDIYARWCCPTLSSKLISNHFNITVFLTNYDYVVVSFVCRHRGISIGSSWRAVLHLVSFFMSLRLEQFKVASNMHKCTPRCS